MNNGFLSLYESHLEDEKQCKEYQKKRSTQAVVINRVEIAEAEFNRIMSVTTDGRVFYIDHVLLGVIRKERFVSERWAYKVVSISGVRKIRTYLELS